MTDCLGGRLLRGARRGRGAADRAGEPIRSFINQSIEACCRPLSVSHACRSKNAAPHAHTRGARSARGSRPHEASPSPGPKLLDTHSEQLVRWRACSRRGCRSASWQRAAWCGAAPRTSSCARTCARSRRATRSRADTCTLGFIHLHATGAAEHPASRSGRVACCLTRDAAMRFVAPVLLIRNTVRVRTVFTSGPPPPT